MDYDCLQLEISTNQTRGRVVLKLLTEDTLV